MVHSRCTALANSHVGRAFEGRAIEVLASKGIALERDFPVKVGVQALKKEHEFATTDSVLA